MKLAIALAVAWPMWGCAAEPEYAGRTLSEWVEVYWNGFPDHSPPVTAASINAATAAIRAIGTNALPLVLEKMSDGRDSDIGFAQDVLQVLGDEAKPAIPSLIELTRHRELRVRVAAFGCLLSLGPEKTAMVPMLIRLSHDPDFAMRSMAASDLIDMSPEDAKAAGITTNYIYDRYLFGTNRPTLARGSAGGQTGARPSAATGLPQMISGRVPPPRMVLTVPPEYKRQAVKLIIEEANRVAKALKLPENLPITEADLLACYITPPALRGRLPAFGNISTTNYTYYVSVGSKFSFLEKNQARGDYDELARKFLLPMARMDTNAARILASQFLRAASMDVDRLNRECRVHVMAFSPEAPHGKHFVPVYWVFWMKRGEEQLGSVASVELFLPDKSLRTMYVNQSEYILRKPLALTWPPASTTTQPSQPLDQHQ